MPRYPLAGITKLSQLDIDADKDFLGHLLKNIGAAVDGADAMRKSQAILQTLLTTRGDMVFRGSSEAERLALNYGVGWNFLHALDMGQPEWRDIQELIIYLTGASNRWIAPPILSIPAPAVSLAVAEDHSGGGQEAVANLSIPAPSVSQATATSLPLPVDGGVAHNDDVGDTDETAETNNDTANDMHLLPSPGAVGDGFYFGLASLWDWLCLNIGTPGAGVWTITWKYWNDATWAALTLKYDETNHFRAAAGKRWVHFTRPGDWGLKSILGMNLYWIKGEVTAYTSMTQQPLGTRGWIGQY